eukprot:s1705_g7.t2
MYVCRYIHFIHLVHCNSKQERLYAHNSRLRPDLAGKLTGMMLELPNSEILSLLESDEKLKQKIDEAVQATGSEGPEVPKNVEVKAKAKTARPPATASPPAVDAKPAKPAPAKPVPAVKAAAKARSSSTTGGASQAAKVPGSRPLTRVSSKALEKKAKDRRVKPSPTLAILLSPGLGPAHPQEMEQNVKAAQAACLRDSRQSSGRLKSLEVEAASLRRALEAVPAEHSSAIQKVDLPAAASAVPSAPEPPAEEPAEEPPAEEPPPNAETADAEEAEEAPRSGSTSRKVGESKL